MHDRAKGVIGIDDDIPFRVNNASTNDSSHTANAISEQIKPVGTFRFESTSLTTGTIVLLLMFGICTIIYSGEYSNYYLVAHGKTSRIYRAEHHCVEQLQCVWFGEC